MTSPLSLRTQGGVYLGGALTTTSGVFSTGGNVQINKSSNFTTEIGNGTTNALVTIGGASNETDLSSATIKMANISQSSAAQTGTMCWAAGGITYDATLGCLTSSARFKTNINPFRDDAALKIALQLEPVSFRKKEEFGGNADPSEQFGLVAEQVAKVDERLIGRGASGEVLGVRYQQLTAVLAGAIKKLKAENDDLRACNDNWKCRLFGIR
jgi:hypothetical protein